MFQDLVAIPEDDQYNAALSVICESSVPKITWLGKLRGKDLTDITNDILNFLPKRRRKLDDDGVVELVTTVYANQHPPEPLPMDEPFPEPVPENVPELPKLKAEGLAPCTVNDDELAIRLITLNNRLEQTGLDEDELREIFREIREIKLKQNSQIVADWLLKTPAPPDQILADTLDRGDKLAIIGSSKMRKSFFLLMFLLCLAAGRDFLKWRTPKPRRVVLIQLEIQEAHFHRRVLNMANALSISPADLGDRFIVINCRGLGVEGPEGIELIGRVTESYHPEIIAFDPLYKVAVGAENAIEDAKKILSSFDGLIEKTGAAIAYVHHDAKGQSGDRDIRDRGAGSNVIGRDYDAAITLTPHVSDTDAIVVEAMVRNYKPQEPFTIQWVEDEITGGYRFDERSDIMPEKKTSKTRTALPALSDYLPMAASILGNEEMAISLFKESFKRQSGLSDNRVKGFLAWAVAGGNPYLVTREEKSRAVNKKWVRIGRVSADV